jgi:hypothetical protein
METVFIFPLPVSGNTRGKTTVGVLGFVYVGSALMKGVLAAVGLSGVIS